MEGHPNWQQIHKWRRIQIPVEGEALAIVDALDKARYFILGCPDLTILTVITDHKPLVKLFGDRSLNDIPNPRLLRLKERSLRYKF